MSSQLLIVDTRSLRQLAHIGSNNLDFLFAGDKRVIITNVVRFERDRLDLKCLVHSSGSLMSAT